MVLNLLQIHMDMKYLQSIIPSRGIDKNTFAIQHVEAI